MKKLDVIKILTQNTCVSGENIAKRLRVSRNMVWKTVNSLITEGYKITSTPKGYSFISFPNTLTEEELYLNCGEDFDIKVFDTLPSTNAYCHDNVDGFTKNTVIIARSQSHGKGRLNRNFYSPNGGLYLSFCFKQPLPIRYFAHITLYSALAVAKAIEEVCEVSVDIKWVNDLFINGKKICGILSEANLSCEEKLIKHFTVGIGVNVNTDNFDLELKDIATSIRQQTKKPVNMAVLTARIIKNVSKLPEQISTPFLNEYRKKCFIIGKTVYHQNQPVTVLGIDDDCSLLIDKQGEKLKLFAGEVSLKL